MLGCAAWESLSMYLNPNEIGILLNKSCHQSKLNFKRVRTIVIKNMFQYVVYDVQKKRNELYSNRELFEWLTACGYLPKPSIGYNNSNFGYLEYSIDDVSMNSQTSEWIEWQVADVCRIRCFWDKMLSKIKSQERQAILLNLQYILSFLPGIKVKCESCHWNIPINSMQNKMQCIYCFDEISKNNLKSTSRNIKKSKDGNRSENVDTGCSKRIRKIKGNDEQLVFTETFR